MKSCFLYTFLICVAFRLVKIIRLIIKQRLRLDLFQKIQKKIQVDSIFLDSITTTYVGNSQIFDRFLYFVDMKFSYVYKFDLKGTLLHRFIGQGAGKQ